MVLFLTNRKQQFSVNGTLSESRTLSTGAPQGCVSSPILFTLYTDECRRCYSNNYIIKFSDDTAILGLLKMNGICLNIFQRLEGLWIGVRTTT